MKNITIAGVLAVFVCLIYSCSKGGIIHGSGHLVSDCHPLPSFSYIQQQGSINVVLVKDSTYSVKVETDDNIIAYVQAEVNGSVLTIKFKDNYLIKGDQTTVYVHCPYFVGAGVEGSGSISSADEFNLQQVNLQLDGSGSLNLQLAAVTVTNLLSGSGTVTVAGKANQVNNTVTGSGTITTANLDALNAVAVVRGSGCIYLQATSDLHVDIEGSGNVYYTGNPVVTEQINGSGNVYRK